MSTSQATQVLLAAPFRRVGIWSLCLSALILAGCGAGDGDPLASYRQQTLKWHACDWSTFPEQLKELAEQTGVADRTQCTSIRVPMDYDHPQGRSLEIGISRVKAVPSAQQPEPLLSNPGGPGGDGYWHSVFDALGWSDQTEQDAQLWAQRQALSQRFELIGFSPRGLGESTQLICSSKQLLEPENQSLQGRTVANMQAELRNTETIARACAENALTPFVNSETTARDMDLIRAVLGAPRLNYIGASYGTWLGLWYAGLFPERVGRLVLDSSVDFTRDLSAAMLNQGESLTRVFDQVLAAYAARHPDVFGLGTDADAIRRLPQQLTPVVRAATARVNYSLLFNRSGADNVLHNFQAGMQLSQPPFLEAWDTALQMADFAPLRQAVQRHSFSRRPDLQATLNKAALEIIAKVEAVSRARPVTNAEVDFVYTAVVCNDSSPAFTDATDWAQQLTQFYERYPVAGTQDLRSCLGWKRPNNVVRPSLSAVGNMEILMLQSQLDGATPAQGAQITFDHLPGARMVFVPGSIQHGLYTNSSACVTRHLQSYLLGQSPPSRMNLCEDKPLPLDATAPQ